MKIYLDQNIWEYVIQEFTVSSFLERIKRKQFELCLGLHNIYEFGRCFLENDMTKIEKGKIIFKYLHDLKIEFFANTEKCLIESDITYAKYGGRTIPFPWLDSLNIVATKQEIYHLSIGNFSKAKQFIKNREDGLTKNTPVFRQAVISNNSEQDKPLNVQILMNDWGCRRDIINQTKYATMAKNISDSVLFSEPTKYPFLNTFINVNIHLNFIALAKPQGPSKKRTSDYRHLIISNAADIFVTNDMNLKKNSLTLCPHHKVLDTTEFKEMLTK
ncbi:MAG: hypothetical protein A3I11_02460 [Elusimicrobia bacterium RIFCSPLOWO2_02_FULL_39_32]|nr:MAG: hypothetical protein A2034_04375 [Elusimicrobia bacterium GWA2_38_7]OGR78480.1 MAG: hypothetical protein A3B80_07345 [Elusimicrobia bacterium RIFCSPHIGHO2_02_FULL_39_36]OGR92239.1 MAG: hypothetical protein A3I11_02460 [Elusimicrobia bacterium RIFCSPLOWO2_02_FULL_39_32]OGR99894.1 MAG: hypothetical protein A3G85_02980 [Elusimicrobia bacterium RIFCSPLOWO2_12_FULL_39_28]